MYQADAQLHFCMCCTCGLLFSNDLTLPPLYYSMIKKDNAPANIKIRSNENYIMIDRVLNYNLIIDNNDDIIRKLNNNEIKYNNTLIYKMLERRNLLF